MKLKINLVQRTRNRLIRQFGQANLIQLPNGQHELIGGTNSDRAAAFEWASLFAHEIVFTHFDREAAVRRTIKPGWNNFLSAQPVTLASYSR